MEKILKLTIFAFFSLFNILNVNALNIDKEKYRIEILNEYSEETMDYNYYNNSNGFSIKSKINKESSQLDKGLIDVEITFDNDVENEIMYVIDNTSKLTSKNNVVDKLKNAAINIEKLNIKQGIVTTTTNGKLITYELSHSNTEENLEKVKKLDFGNEGDVFQAVKNAKDKFSSKITTNKILIMVVNSLGNKDLDSLKSIMDELKEHQIKVLVYGADFQNSETDFYKVFDNVKKEQINFNEYKYFLRDIEYKFAESKHLMAMIHINDNLLNNFEIKNVKSNKNDFYFDETEKIIASVQDFGHEMQTIYKNEKFLIQFTISLKEEVDDDITEQTFSIVDNISGMVANLGDRDSLSRSGPSYFDFVKLNDIPTFKVIKEENEEPKKDIEEEIENPNTGIKEEVILSTLTLIIVLVWTKIKVKNKIMKI